jgi:hypothetical protein
MGIFKPFSSCDSEGSRAPEPRRQGVVTVTPKKKRRSRQPNPNPRRFIVERVEEYGARSDGLFDFVIAKIHYPDCTNYEGRKLLLYANTSEAELRAATFLDPHFCDHSEHHSPIARFTPTNAGWAYARRIARKPKARD